MSAKPALLAFMKSINRLNEALDSRRDAADSLIRPIAEALGHKRLGGLTEIEHCNGGLRATYVSHWRGDEDIVYVELPDSVLNADDPVATATEIFVARSTERAEVERRNMLLEIDRLTRRLT